MGQKILIHFTKYLFIFFLIFITFRELFFGFYFIFEGGREGLSISNIFQHFIFCLRFFFFFNNTYYFNYYLCKVLKLIFFLWFFGFIFYFISSFMLNIFFLRPMHLARIYIHTCVCVLVCWCCCRHL